MIKETILKLKDCSLLPPISGNSSTLRSRLLASEKHVPDNEPIFRNLSLEVVAGDFIFVNGENGVGKTSLAKLLLGHEMVFEGVKRIDPSLTVRGVINSEFSSFPYLTVHENIKILCRLLNCDEKLDQIYQLIEQRKLDHLLQKEIRILSKGQKAQILLTIFLCSPWDLFIIDETFDVLDTGSYNFFRERFCEVCINQNRALINFSHRKDDSTLWRRYSWSELVN